jgi:hypothetical protein
MLEEAGRLLEERIGSLSGADTEESRAELERMRADVEERLRELLREERP